MNERIFKLALEAMDFQGAVDIDTELKLTNSELEKFAELIVKECAKVCHEQALIESEKGSLKSLYKEVALDDIGCKIAKHFGVEE
jgi:hypothetical protein